MKSFYWLVKREFWEHRGAFFTAPLVTGILFLVVTIMGWISLEVFRVQSHWNFPSVNPGELRHGVTPEQLANFGTAVDGGLVAITYVIVFVTAIAVFFYCLGSLYDERKDRSILFWKSLPQSDTATVLSKVVSGVVLAPVIATLIGVVTGALLVMVLIIVGLVHGLDIGTVLSQAHPFQVLLNLILLIPLYAIWALPTVGWLMLCSAWARSKPFLWAIAIPLGTGLLLFWISAMGVIDFDIRWYAANVSRRLLAAIFPGMWVFDSSSVADMHEGARTVLDLSFNYSALAHPSAWIGAIAGGVMIAGAIWFRRWRDDS